MADDNTKNFPPATAEVAKMMGMDGNHEETTLVPAGNGPVANLPVVETVNNKENFPPQLPVAHEQTFTEKIAQSLQSRGDTNSADEFNQSPKTPNPVLRVAKTIIPYILVFAIGIFLYFFFFSSFDFTKLFSSTPTPQSVKDTAIEQLEKQDMTAYNGWIQSFYYDVSDPAVIDPNADNSGNGLTNFQKFLLDLNPKSYDTIGLGMADSQALAQGINPLSGQPLNDSQKQILNKYFDMEVIANRLALEKLNGTDSGGIVGGSGVLGAQQVQATTSVSSYNAPSQQNTILASAQSADVINGNGLDINTAVPGRLQIPSLKIDAPLIFSKSANDFETDLLNGVIHYPGTALPGQIGTTYISGHSSNYVWVKSNYNHIFTHLDGLTNDESFQIIVTLNSGKTATLHYVVTNSQQFSPTDQLQFANAGKSVVALSTCWPVGSTAKRLVVFGQLTQIDQ